MMRAFEIVGTTSFVLWVMMALGFIAFPDRVRARLNRFISF